MRCPICHQPALSPRVLRRCATSHVLVDREGRADTNARTRAPRKSTPGPLIVQSRPLGVWRETLRTPRVPHHRRAHG